MQRKKLMGVGEEVTRARWEQCTSPLGCRNRAQEGRGRTAWFCPGSILSWVAPHGEKEDMDNLTPLIGEKEGTKSQSWGEKDPANRGPGQRRRERLGSQAWTTNTGSCTITPRVTLEH
jgi:hypothetical protein